jgi:hypothetical protein
VKEIARVQSDPNPPPTPSQSPFSNNTTPHNNDTSHSIPYHPSKPFLLILDTGGPIAPHLPCTLIRLQVIILNSPIPPAVIPPTHLERYEHDGQHRDQLPEARPLGFDPSILQGGGEDAGG